MIPKISIIIPVYNAVKYLRRCLDSILSQNFQDFEVILVDDCSLDDSVAIIKQYCQKDIRINLIMHSINIGPMKAREHGWKLAKGDYIMFVDSDDFLLPNALEKLYAEIFTNEDVDIVSGCIICKSFSGFTINKVANSLPYGENSFGVYKALLEQKFMHSLCGKIYKRLLFTGALNSYINFRNGEDAMLFYQLISISHKIKILDEDVYVYFMSEDSSSRRRMSNQQIINILKSWDCIQVYIEKYPDLLSLFYLRRLNSILQLLKNNYDKKFILDNISFKQQLKIGTFFKYYSGRVLLYNLLIYYSKFFRINFVKVKKTMGRYFRLISY